MIPFELRLFRKDMTKASRDIPLEQLDGTHVLYTMRDLALAHRVVFIDTDGTSFVWKDRTSQVAVVVKRPRMTTIDCMQQYIMNLEWLLTLERK